MGFETALNDSYYLNRVRLRANLEPREWLRATVEFQDARAPGILNAEGFADRNDVRLAYLALGRARSGWELTIGRQEIPLGDERLVAADSYWDPLGRSWDGASLAYRRGDLKLSWFAASNLASIEKRLNRPDWHDRLFGFVATLPKGPGKVQLEPYFLYDETLPGRIEDGRDPNERTATFGTRAVGELPARCEYNFEAAFQRGSNRGEPVEAWAWYGGITHQIGASDRAPRVGFEYNFATGDRDPGDGRHATFNDLHSSNYNQWGLADPLIWRNTHAGAISGDWAASRRWKLSAGYRAFWLATRADRLYTADGDPLEANPSVSSAHVGNQICAMVAFALAERVDLYAGYGRFFPGLYLKESGFDGPLSTPFVMLNFRF